MKASLPALLLFAAGLHLAACNAQPPLHGTVTPHPGWKPVLYLIQPQRLTDVAASYGGKVIDSAAVAPDGSFAFSNLSLPAEPTLYQLAVQPTGSRYPTRLFDDDPALANYMPLVLQNGRPARIHAAMERFMATVMLDDPSAANASLLALRSLRLASWEAQKQALTADTHDDESALLEHEAALLRFRQPLMDFADTCAAFLPAMAALRWVSPAGDYERVPEFLFRQCTRAHQTAPNHAWTAQLCQSAHPDKLPVLQGDTIPNFPLPMASGDTVMLYDLLGEKLTLLDIWASWCAPCRKENREVLAPLWAERGNTGLQIVGYAIDSSPQAWKAAIAKDGATWPQASHLSGDDTPFLRALNITTIPANFILDKNGVVLAKNLHGEALKAFLEGR